MKIEKIRHGLRYAVNGAALVAAVIALPEFGAVVPAIAIAKIAGGVAIANTVLSILRPFTE